MSSRSLATLCSGSARHRATISSRRVGGVPGDLASSASLQLNHPARRISLRSASARLNSTRTTDHASAINRPAFGSRLTLPAPWPHGLTPAGVESPVNLAHSRPPTIREATMDAQALRLLIRRKIWDGRLPPDRLSRVSWGPSNGESCDACSVMVTRAQVLMQGTTLAGDVPTRFHIRCFHIWNDERHTTRARTA